MQARQEIDPNEVDPSQLGPPPDDGRGPNAGLPDDGTNAGPAIIGVCWMLVTLSALFLATRMYMKIRGRRGLWWDDHVLVGSWFMLVGYAITATLAVHVGLGTHNGNPSAIQQMVSIWTVFSSLGAAWSKTSFAIMLLRVTDRSIKIGLWTIIVTLNLVLTFNAILPFIWCNPSSKAWNPFMFGACWNRTIVINLNIFGAAYSAGMDFILALIPWFVLMKLKMKRNEKIGVAVCMSLGIVAGTTSIVRSVKVPLLFQNDFTYEAGQLAMWTAAELAVTIIAASIPVLRTMIRSVVTHKSYVQSGNNGTFVDKSHTTVITGGGRDRSQYRSKGVSSGKDADSMTSLSLPHQDNANYIVKFESIAVDYETNSVEHRGNSLDMYAFEMDRVTPTKVISETRIGGR